MIPEKLTLRELWSKKAKEYYMLSRDMKGRLTKSLDQCYEEVQEDYGTSELDAYNLWWKGHWNRIMSADQQIVWSDGTYDDARECFECKTLCHYPVHAEHYKEVGAVRDEEHNEGK